MVFLTDLYYFIPWPSHRYIFFEVYMNKSSKVLLRGGILLVVVLVLVAAVAWNVQNSPVASASSPEESTLASSDVFIPLLPNNVALLTKPNILGVQMEGNTGSTNPHYDYMIGSGASWIRVTFQWKLIEPTLESPHQYNWNSGDTFTQAAQPRNGGLNFVVTLSGNPDWASNLLNGPLYDPVGIDGYAAFVAAAVERYDGDGYLDAPGGPIVNYWEIYNEPDNGYNDSRGHWGHDGDKYAELLEVLYPVIKAANPNAQLVFGGMAYDWFEEDGGPFVRTFLDDVLAAGGGDYFDILNYHFYPAYWVNWTSPQSPGLLEKANYIEAKMASYGYANKPHIVTEAGWHSNDHPVYPSNEEQQARYVVELLTQSAATGAEAMVWISLHDPSDGRVWKNGLTTLGTQEVTPVPKAAYFAFQTAVEEIGTADFVRLLSDGETGSSTMEVYEFHDSSRGRKVYVAWLDPIHSVLQRSLRLPASTAVVRDIYNNSSSVVHDSADGAVDGFVTVTVGGQPVYIEVGS
jgi:hypothetical protein